ncbi:MAG: HDOD domain-containing protein [Candidatus Eisenbacteria bacterium]
MKATLNAILARLDTLPPARPILIRLLRMASEPDIGARDLVGVVEVDVSLTANLLRVCNTPEYSGSRPIATLNEAVLRLGTRTLLQLVIAQECEGVMSGVLTGYGLTRSDLWRHSTGAGTAARILAQKAHEPRTALAYTGALLHDLGKVVLDVFLQQQVKEIVARVRAGADFATAEAEVLGVGHDALGARIAQKWGFPDPLVWMIGHHHSPGSAPGEQKLCSLVHLGDAVAHWLGIGLGRPELAARFDAKVVDLLGLTPGDLDQVVIEVSEKMAEKEDLLAA